MTAIETIRVELSILYVDAGIVAINKPAGLLVHRGWANDREVAMSRLRDQLGERVYPVHRLDRQTSGALLFARNPEMHRKLRQAFETAMPEKRYLAVVRGHPPDEGRIDYAIPRTESGPRVSAVTDYRSLYRIPHYTFVEAFPRTGRLHQLRRHFKHLGHPIVWDKKYSRGRFNEFAARDFGVQRMVLHARELTFHHPETGARVHIVAPVLDLKPVFEAMGIPATLWDRS